MPLLNQFNSSQSFYSTFFHEISHSTGHKKRLNRKEVVETSFFGSCDYGTEELTAELTSAFICAEIGISNENTERNSIAYLKNWKNAIKADKKLFLMASQRASKSAKYILNKQEETHEE
jgi:antirestriction protein ArdC